MGRLVWKVVPAFISEFIFFQRIKKVFKNIFLFRKNNVLHSFLNIPLVLYPSIILISYLWYDFINYVMQLCNIFISSTEVKIFLIIEFFTLLNYCDIILLQFFCESENIDLKSKIKATLSDFDIHIDLLKKIIGPVSLLGIVSTVISVSNAIFPNYLKANLSLLRDFFNTNMFAVLTLVVVFLVYAAINYFIILLLRHLVENSKEYFGWYGYMIKKIFRWLNIL
jgi:hypothetical protein